MFRRQLLVDSSLLALLALIIVTTTFLYISSEHNFYWWVDWWYKAIAVADTYRQSPFQALNTILQSLKTERNSLYTLPLVPFILTFGDSRLTYELGLALVYLLPFSLTIGAISTQLSNHSRSVFWSTTFLSLLVPVIWIPTFLGIPDTGGALLIALATLAYLQDIRLKRWWRIGLIGLLIAAATLLRRHFIYGGIALLSVMTLQALFLFVVEVRKNSPSALRNLLGYSLRLSLIAVTILTVLMAIAGEFTGRALTTNYIGLYASWSLPVNDMVERYARFYGWATWLLVAIGFSAGMLTRVLSLSTSLICLSGLLVLVEWLLLLRYGNIFYNLHVTPLVVIGLAAFLWTSWFTLTGIRILVLSVASCYLISNLVIGLTPLGNFDSPLRPLFALSVPPLVRTDYDEAVRLVHYLRELAPNQEPIYVVGHQRLQLNASLVKAVQSVIYRNNKILNTLTVPQVDSEDFYPLETLLQAQYVVVPNYIPQYPGSVTKVTAVGEWLPPQEHDVVRVVLDAFTQNWEIAQDFKRLPVQFTFEQGTVISIYQRTRLTSLATAIRTFYTMQQQIGKRPGSQLDWLVLHQMFPGPAIVRNSDQTYQLWTRPVYSSQEITSFLYINPLPEQINVTGELNFLNKQPLGVTLQLATVNQQGEIINSTEAVYSPSGTSFTLSLKGGPANYLLLNAISRDGEKDNIYNYNLKIDRLSVSTQHPQ